MADNYESDDMTSEAPLPPPAKGKSKLLVIGIPLLLVQAAIAYFVVVKFIKPEMPPPGEEPQEAVVEKKEKTAFGPEFLVENLTVNTKEGRRNHYVVVSVSFECEEQGVVDELTLRNSQVSDMVITTISSLSWEQVNDLVYRTDTLRVQLVQKANDVVLAGRVLNVYFPQFIIQH